MEIPTYSSRPYSIYSYSNLALRLGRIKQTKSLRGCKINDEFPLNSQSCKTYGLLVACRWQHLEGQHDLGPQDQLPFGIKKTQKSHLLSWKSKWTIDHKASRQLSQTSAFSTAICAIQFRFHVLICNTKPGVNNIPYLKFIKLISCKSFSQNTKVADYQLQVQG